MLSWLLVLVMLSIMSVDVRECIACKSTRRSGGEFDLLVVAVRLMEQSMMRSELCLANGVGRMIICIVTVLCS